MADTSPDDPDILIRRAAKEAVRPAVSGQPDLPALPRNVDRRAGAALVTRFFFPVSRRSLEAWPLTWRRVNGKAVVSTAELLALAEAKLQAAAPVRGGRRLAEQPA
jgi:hypothetical protein